MKETSSTAHESRLAIQSLSVENLRSLQDLPAVPLEADLTILVGQNGGGKTSFIDALSILLDGNSPTDEARSSNDRDIVVIGEFRTYDESECLRVRATHTNGSVRREVLRLVHPHFGNTPESMTLPDLRRAFDSAGIQPPGGTSKTPFVERALEWVRQRPQKEFQEVWVALPAETAARLPKLTIFKSQDAVDQTAQLRRLITRESQRLLATEEYTPRLTEIASEIQDDIDPVLTLIKEMIKRYCPGINDVSINASFDFSRVSPQVQMRLTKSNGESIDLNEAGAGLMQRVGLAMYASTLETLQGATADTFGTVLAYDEPDSHLDYQAQRELLEIMRGQARLPHVQLVAATHSVNLIDTVRLQALRHFRLEDERTRVDVPSAYSSNLSEFVGDLASGLGLRNSVLLSEKCFLIVEGSTEERSLLILFEKITGETLASAGITLVNTGGAGSVRRLVEVLILQLKRSVVVLVDEDARHSPGRINEEWLSNMGLVEGTNSFFTGTKEFEDAFDDEVWLRVAKGQFPLTDGTDWETSDLAATRAGEQGMGQALENLFSRRTHGRVTKPQIGEALARTVSVEEVPVAIRDALLAALNFSRDTGGNDGSTDL